MPSLARGLSERGDDVDRPDLRLASQQLRADLPEGRGDPAAQMLLAALHGLERVEHAERRRVD